MDWFFGDGNRNKGKKKPSQSQKRDDVKAASGRQDLNKRANQAAAQVGLNQNQKQAFHRTLTGMGDNNLSFSQLVSIAKDHKN